MKTISTGFFIFRVEADSFRRLMIGLAMLLTAIIAVVLTPNKRIADSGAYVDLELLIPKQFGGWRNDENMKQVVVDPRLQEVIKATYRATLSRTYLDAHGKRIMLSMAYGGSHGENMQTHRPEICYPAQGFSIVEPSSNGLIRIDNGSLAVTRLVAKHGIRNEPITYWVVVGGVRTEFGIKMKLAQMRYRLTGVIPDGMLVRISSIDNNNDRAFMLHQRFIRDLLSSVKGEDRRHIIGEMQL